MEIRTGRLRFGPDNGHMLLRTGRKGAGSAVGHDLTIEVTDWSVEVNVSETGPADATATARVELGSLAVRTGTGGARPLTDKDCGEIENNARVGYRTDPQGVGDSYQVPEWVIAGVAAQGR